MSLKYEPSSTPLHMSVKTLSAPAGVCSDWRQWSRGRGWSQSIVWNTQTHMSGCRSVQRMDQLVPGQGLAGEDERERRFEDHYFNTLKSIQDLSRGAKQRVLPKP